MTSIIFFNSLIAGTDFRHQVLTSKDGPCAERIKIEAALKE